MRTQNWRLCVLTLAVRRILLVLTEGMPRLRSFFLICARAASSNGDEAARLARYLERAGHSHGRLLSFLSNLFRARLAAASGLEHFFFSADVCFGNGLGFRLGTGLPRGRRLHHPERLGPDAINRA